jgi:hypothetical protein
VHKAFVAVAVFLRQAGSSNTSRIVGSVCKAAVAGRRVPPNKKEYQVRVDVGSSSSSASSAWWW